MPSRLTVAVLASLPRLARSAAVLAVTLLGACGGDGPSGPPPVTPALVIVTGTVVPRGVLVAHTVGTALPAGALSATLGTASVAPSRLDDSTLAFEVPPLAVGTHLLVVNAASGALSASVQVVPAPLVADAQAYLDASLAAADAEVGTLDADLADPRLAATAADSADLRDFTRTLRDSIAVARQRLAALTPEQRAQVAALVAARLHALEVLESAPAASLVRSVRYGLAPADVVGSQYANELCLGLTDTLEGCNGLLIGFSDQTAAELALLTGLGIAAYAEGLTGVGIAVAVVTAVTVIRKVKVLSREIVVHFRIPTVGSLLQEEEIVRAAIVRAEEGIAAQVAPPPAVQYFVTGVTRDVRVRARYRTLVAADLAVPGLAPIASRASRIVAFANVIRRAFFMGDMRTLLPATPARQLVAPIPGRFLTVDEVAPGTITVSGTAADTTVRLRFTRAGLASDLPFTYTLRYVPPGRQPQEREMSAILISTPRFIAKSLVPGNYGLGTCAISEAGVAHCWGWGAGQLNGDQVNRHRDRPTAIRALGLVTQHQSSAYGPCGLTSGGRIGCVSGDTLHADTTLSGLSAFAKGAEATCGLAGGRIRCKGSMNPSLTPTGWTLVAGVSDFTRVAAGQRWACGLTSAGAAYCWGYNQLGALGGGTGEYSESAVPVSGGHVFTSISLGSGHACGLTTSGKAYCWGRNHYNQVGTTTAPAVVDAPIASAPALTFTKLVATAWSTCGVATDGRIYCWGENTSGQLGSETPYSTSQTPVPVFGTQRYADVVLGNMHGCGLTTSGAVYCWGANSGGALGIGTFAENMTYLPTAVTVPE